MISLDANSEWILTTPCCLSDFLACRKEHKRRISACYDLKTKVAACQNETWALDKSFSLKKLSITLISFGLVRFASFRFFQHHCLLFTTWIISALQLQKWENSDSNVGQLLRFALRVSTSEEVASNSSFWTLWLLQIRALTRPRLCQRTSAMAIPARTKFWIRLKKFFETFLVLRLLLRIRGYQRQRLTKAELFSASFLK